MMDSRNVLTKKDFVEALKIVFQWLNKLDLNQGESLKLLQDSYGEFIGKFKNDFDTGLNDLKGKVDSVFVGERVGAIEKRSEDLIAKIIQKMSLIKDGKTPTGDELVALIKPLIPLPLKGLKGDSADSKEVGDLQKRVKNLETEIKTLRRRPIGGGGPVGRDWIKDIDISDQLNGVKKTFDIQGVWNIISVHCSAWPYALRKTVDFTYTKTSITFTSEINAESVLKAGQTVVLTAVLA